MIFNVNRFIFQFHHNCQSYQFRVSNEYILFYLMIVEKDGCLVWCEESEIGSLCCIERIDDRIIGNVIVDRKGLGK